MHIPAFKSCIVPVVVLQDAAHAVPLARALLAGGIDVIEITLRTEAGLPAIARIAREVPEMYVGAGTVTRTEEVHAVQAAGARFALSPGFSPAVCHAALAANMPFIPGVMTPSEVLAARDLGFGLMKLFPAAQAGGIAMLKALAGPLPEIRFCPTGGVSLDNLQDFLKQPNVAMVGGSWLAPQALMQQGDWAAITQIAQDSRAKAR